MNYKTTTFKKKKLSDFWQNIEAAKEVPKQAKVSVLVKQVEELLSQLSFEQQLRIAGTAITEIAEIYQSKSETLLEDWQQKYNPTEPDFNEELLAGLVRQSMSLDLSELLEPSRRQRVTPTNPEIESVAGEVDKQKLLEVLDQEQIKQQIWQTSYEENVTAWCDQISLWFSEYLAEECSLIELVEGTGLSLGQVWLSLLLGGFKLKRNSGEFYDPSSILIMVE